MLVEPLTVTHPDAVTVGDALPVAVIIRNRGDAGSQPIGLRFTNLSSYATFESCTPACETTVLYGDISVAFAVGVRAGETTTFTVEFVTTKPGDAYWDMYVDEGARQGFFVEIGHTYIAPPETPAPTPEAPAPS